MTEAEWLACPDACQMCGQLGNIPKRKERLFACACVRQCWDRLEDERSRRAVEVGEQFADGLATPGDLQRARSAAYEAARAEKAQRSVWTGGTWGYAACYALEGIHLTTLTAVRSTLLNESREAAWPSFTASAAVLLRDVFGSIPFRSLALAPACRTPDVRSLAQAAYDNRDLPAGTLDGARLAVLADALEDVGADPAILSHLRGPGPHVRGCHVLDLCLG
jgi:hypothetical protein